MRKTAGFLGLLMFLVLAAWVAGTWLGKFQEKIVNNCSQTRAELGLCK